MAQPVSKHLSIFPTPPQNICFCFPLSVSSLPPSPPSFQIQSSLHPRGLRKKQERERKKVGALVDSSPARTPVQQARRTATLHIVTFDWLEASLLQASKLPEAPYLLLRSLELRASAKRAKKFAKREYIARKGICPSFRPSFFFFLENR